LHAAAERLRRLFDLGADPAMIAAHLDADPRLGPSVVVRPGLRVPGAWDPFELAVRAIFVQQVSVAAAVKLAGRFASIHGEPVDCEDHAALGLTRLFPLPGALVEADPARLGMPAARVAAIAALARATVATLEALPGVGPWTGQYIAMRGLSEPDAFPSGDLVLRQVLADDTTRTPGATTAPARAVAELAEAWRPWRAYAALHLWTEGSEDDGTADRSD
jgi:AraC family transcriptional regulator of adaptative response / DNA-3-methyladenine glycosylase II